MLLNQLKSEEKKHRETSGSMVIQSNLELNSIQGSNKSIKDQWNARKGDEIFYLFNHVGRDMNIEIYDKNSINSQFYNDIKYCESIEISYQECK